MAAHKLRARFYYFLCASVLIMTIVLVVSQQIEVHAIIVDHAHTRLFIGGINPCPSCDELAATRPRTKKAYPTLKTTMQFQVIPSSPTTSTTIKIPDHSVVNYVTSATETVSSVSKSENAPFSSRPTTEFRPSYSTVDFSVSNTVPSFTVKTASTGIDINEPTSVTLETTPITSTTLSITSSVMKAKSIVAQWPRSYRNNSPARNLREKICRHMTAVSPPIFNMTSKIPQIIHQTWISTSIPAPTKPWIEKWKVTNPDWTYMFWTDKSSRDFITKYYKPLLEIYDSYQYPVQKADMFRYIILFAFGGVYADLDIEPLKSLNPIRDWSPCILSREPEAHHQVATWNYFGRKPELNYTLTCNAFMACRPGHPYLFFLLSFLAERSPKVTKKKCTLAQTLWCTGPTVETEAAVFYKRALGDLVKTYPSDDLLIAKSVDFLPIFDQKQLEMIKKNCRYPKKMPKLGLETCNILRKRNFKNFDVNVNESYTVHHWYGSYHKKKGELNKNIEVKDLVPNVTYFFEREVYFNITYL